MNPRTVWAHADSRLQRQRRDGRCPHHAASTACTRRHWLSGTAALGLAILCGCERGPGAPSSPASTTAGSRAAPDPSLEICVVAPPIPHDPASGLAPDQPRPIPKDARCPVCGMYPARMPRWAAQVLYRDGHAHFFDSPVDLMQFLGAVPHHSPGYTADDLLSSWVTDAARTTAGKHHWVPLQQAWFVHGSDALGPMRRGDLPAFATQAQAEAFSQKRGGRALAFTDIGPDIIRSLSVDRHQGLHDHGAG